MLGQSSIEVTGPVSDYGPTVLRIDLHEKRKIVIEWRKPIRAAQGQSIMYENTFVGRVDRFRIYGFYEDRLEELLSIIPYEAVNKWNNSKVTWSENTSKEKEKKEKSSVKTTRYVGCWKCTHLGMRPIPTSVTSIRHPSLNGTSFVPPCRPISYYYANPTSIYSCCRFSCWIYVRLIWMLLHLKLHRSRFFSKFPDI